MFLRYVSRHDVSAFKQSSFLQNRYAVCKTIKACVDKELIATRRQKLLLVL